VIRSRENVAFFVAGWMLGCARVTEQSRKDALGELAQCPQIGPSAMHAIEAGLACCITSDHVSVRDAVCEWIVGQPNGGGA
jgi:hypothetical protein